MMPLLQRFWTRPNRGYRHVAHFERVLGTALELQVLAKTRALAIQAERALLAEIDRLELVFSRFKPDSELNRWQATVHQDISLSADLSWLLAQALEWQRRSGGAFHPGADALGGLWREAAQRGQPPTPAQLEESLQALRQPLYRTQGDVARRLSAVTLNFNAFAKGRIVDLACQAASSVPGVREVLLNIGGDLRHWGAQPVLVSIANPARADNLKALGRIKICQQGVATSGETHRGWQIGDRWYSHVLDPRTGQPVQQVVSASVIAPDSATADVLATIFSVLEPFESLELADSLPNVGCLLVTAAGEVVSNAFWRKHEIT